MITAYRIRGTNMVMDWSLFSDTDAKSDVRSWLDEMGYGYIRIEKVISMPLDFNGRLADLAIIEWPPEDLQMLIKLSFPTLRSVLANLGG